MVSWWGMLGAFHARAEAGNAAAQARIQKNPRVWVLEGEHHDDFERFVLETTVKVPKVGRTQVRTLTAGRRRVDFVGRFEHFDRDVAVVRERLGLPPVDAAPHVNKSNSGHYRDYYNDKTRNHVAEVFAKDIDAFGYTF
jgi:hypothetical protein